MEPALALSSAYLPANCVRLRDDHRAGRFLGRNVRTGWKAESNCHSAVACARLWKRNRLVKSLATRTEELDYLRVGFGASHDDEADRCGVDHLAGARQPYFASNRICARFEFLVVDASVLEELAGGVARFVHAAIDSCSSSVMTHSACRQLHTNWRLPFRNLESRHECGEPCRARMGFVPLL